MLRECLQSGLNAVGIYVMQDEKLTFTPLEFENLSRSVEICRDILDLSGQVEKSQAAAAVLNHQISVGIDGRPITDEEIRLK